MQVHLPVGHTEAMQTKSKVRPTRSPDRLMCYAKKHPLIPTVRLTVWFLTPSRTESAPTENPYDRLTPESDQISPPMMQQATKDNNTSAPDTTKGKRHQVNMLTRYCRDGSGKAAADVVLRLRPSS